MSQTETAQAAAAVASQFLSEFAADGDENALRILGLGDTQPVEAPPVRRVASSPTPAAEAAPAPEATTTPVETTVAEAVEEAVVPDFTPQVSEEWQALLDEPEFDEEARREIALEREDAEYDETFDPDAAAKTRSQEKRIAFLEEQLVKSNRGKWLAEAKRSYPLLATYAADELDAISATSRRSFARAADNLNTRLTKILAPAIADLNAAKALARDDAEAEARAKAAEQWGLPVGEQAGSGSAEADAALLQARAARAPLNERLKILAKSKPLL